MALPGDSPTIMDGPQKGDHVSAPRDKVGVLSGGGEDAASRGLLAAVASAFYHRRGRVELWESSFRNEVTEELGNKK